MGVLGGEENHIIAIYRKFTGPSSCAKNPLAPVPEDGITKPFRRNEGNACTVAFVYRCCTNSQERTVQPLSMRKDLLKFLLGFDGLHEESLDGKALAALCATTGENVAAALCRHASTKTMGSGTLPLVWLIRTLHFYSSRLGCYVKEC